jgi:hypothetical protein
MDRYGLLDEGVIFLEGFFNESFPVASERGMLNQLALVRLDCDMYASTMDVLSHTYHRISPGGVLLHNNWQYTAARSAAIDFRRAFGAEWELAHPVELIDGGSAFWVV